ncbi:MAG TPA: hypothetical protein VHL11_04355 [Phototrophicaceae bacterium]|jgi:hypothetical protein|nr:hypothetical protein [Phototrophicaceae bacterium]
MNRWSNFSALSPQYDERLAQIFHFNAEDLKANQAGELSPRQQEFLRKRVPSMRTSLFFGAFFFLLMSGGSYNAVRNGNINEALGPIGIGLFCLVLIILFTWISRRGVLGDIRHNRIKTSEGVMTVRRSQLSKQTSYYMRVGNQEFSITRFQHDQLKGHLERTPSDRGWRVYFPRTLFYYVLSIERL